MTDFQTNSDEIGVLLRQSAELVRGGRSGEAQRKLEQVLTLDPANPVALNSLGTQALARGAPAEAGAFFGRATEADPSAPALWMNLAAAQRAQGDDEGERQSLARVIAIDQRHFMALVRLAELHERLGERDKALARWEAVIACARLITDLPAAMAPVLDRARTFVAEGSRIFAERIDQSLADVRSGVDRGARRRFDACIDTVLRRRSIYFNQCEGVHFPFLPADEFFDRAHFPWLAELEGKTAEIRQEFEALCAAHPGSFHPYVEMETGMPQSKWTALDHNLDWSAVHLWRHGERIEEICARCPATTAVLEAIPRAHIPRRMPTAFFSVLKPHTRIPAHTGVSNVRAIIHLPLVVPHGCGFRVGGESRDWREGEAWAFDDTIEHEAWNDSSELRALLIFDVWNPHLSHTERDLLSAFYAASDTEAGGSSPNLALGDA